MYSLAWPWALIMLPLPWLIYHKISHALPQQSALKAPFFAEVKQLSRLQRRFNYSRILRLLAFSFIWLMLVLATARPQFTFAQQEFNANGRSMFLLIDTSNSMHIIDVEKDDELISRIELVKETASQLIQQRPSDRIGLMVFANQAYVMAPLSQAHQTLLNWLQELQPGMAGDNTAIGDAIGLGIKRLRQLPSRERVLVLITDGASNSGVMPPLTAAELAAEQNIRIYTLGIGTAQQALSSANADELDEQLLREIAQTTNGRYQRIESLQQVQAFNELMNELEPASNSQNISYVNELYSWPLLIAYTLAMFMLAIQLLRNLYSLQRQQHRGGL